MREKESEKLGFRVSILDNLVKQLHRKNALSRTALQRRERDFSNQI
jgi:hypothetical protein